MDVRFIHEDPACPDVFFLRVEDAEEYGKFNPGTVQHLKNVRMARHAVLWMLPGIIERFYRNLDDVIGHSRALSGSVETP